MWHYYWGDIYKCLLNPDMEMTTDQGTTSNFVNQWVLLRFLKGIWVKGYWKEQKRLRDSPPTSMGNSSWKLETEAHCLQEAQQVGEFDFFRAARAVWASCVAPGELGASQFSFPFQPVCLPALLKVIFFLFRVSHIEMSPSLFCLHIFFPESFLLILIKELWDHIRPLCVSGIIWHQNSVLKIIITAKSLLPCKLAHP